MSETVRPDPFTKWVLGVCGTGFVALTIGLGTTLWRINTTQTVIVTEIKNINSRVASLEDVNKLGDRYTQSQAERDWNTQHQRDDQIERRILRLESHVYGHPTQDS